MTYTGVDIVHIPRFEAWLNYKEAQLLTIFTSR
ncbi:MAG: hypothetical protein QG632_863, partial [Candidatus Dependentiae bacterium]|nr:hypothetical protein [Candidatus Dependentiae bacterium]